MLAITQHHLFTNITCIITLYHNLGSGPFDLCSGLVGLLGSLELACRWASLGLRFGPHLGLFMGLQNRPENGPKLGLWAQHKNNTKSKNKKTKKQNTI